MTAEFKERDESQPLELPTRRSWHQLKNFKKQGMTYELLLEKFLAWEYYLVYCTATGM